MISDSQLTLTTRRIAFILFLLTCIHLAFLTPNPSLLIGERSKLFSGIICFLSLLATFSLALITKTNLNTKELVVSGILIVLVVMSGLFSSTPLSSSARGFVILTSALGGYWGARILLGSQESRSFFIKLSSVLLICLMVLSLIGYYKFGKIYQLFDVHWHSAADKILVFSYSPLWLLSGPESISVFVGGTLLVMTYVALMFMARVAEMESLIGITVILGFLGVCLTRWKPKVFIAILAGLLLLSSVAAYRLNVQSPHLAKSHISIAYRIENVYFSWHMATSHPLLGIGLWAPRNSFLKDYEINYPHLNKKQFVDWVEELRTSENNFLTFLVDLGFPFSIIYISCIVYLLFKLLWTIVRSDPVRSGRALAVFLPLVGAILHFQVFDGLFHPQNSWFFHVLLGMIPGLAYAEEKEEITNWKPIVIQSGLAIICTAVGLIIGWSLGRH